MLSRSGEKAALPIPKISKKAVTIPFTDFFQFEYFHIKKSPTGKKNTSQKTIHPVRLYQTVSSWLLGGILLLDDPL